MNYVLILLRLLTYLYRYVQGETGDLYDQLENKIYKFISGKEIKIDTVLHLDVTCYYI